MICADTAIAAQPDLPDQLRVQEVDDYIAMYRINNNSKKIRNKLIKMSTKQWKLTLFNSKIGYSCKEMDVELGYSTYINYKTESDLTEYIESYEEGVTTDGAFGLVPTSDIYNALLSLLAGFGDQGCNVNVPPRTVVPPSNIKYAIVVFNDMRKLYKKQLKETAYTAMIRCYSIHGDVHKAYELYLEMQMNEITPKLRTFLPMLTQYTAENNIDQSLKLFDELMTKYKLTPSEREYVLVLQVTCATKNNRFYDILNSFKEDVLVPGSDTWSVMRAWFSTLDAKEKYIIDESTVNDAGIVQVNSEILQSIDLDNETKQLLLSQIEEFAIDQRTKVSVNSSRDESGEEEAQASKKRKHNHSVAEASIRLEKWSKFKVWLDNILEKRCGYDVIVDGANVGYYKQNYAGAPSHVDYQQINAMLLKLRHLGYNPLLILHCRHLYKNVVPHDAVTIVDKWRADGILYETPGGCNDDWFWLYMAMYLNCKIVTNDEMRDHHFLMLSSRSFARWRERNQIHFSFGSWVSTSTYDSSDNGVKDKSMIRDANLVIPKVYSHRTQVISCPNRLPSYYVPLLQSDSWLCIYQKVV